jgi:hypothetical protein
LAVFIRRSSAGKHETVLARTGFRTVSQALTLILAVRRVKDGLSDRGTA